MNTKRITVGVAAAAAWNKKKNENMLLGEEELSLLNLWSRARKEAMREHVKEMVVKLRWLGKQDNTGKNTGG